MAISADQERLALSRLYSRFGFGPKPGEFEAALKSGFQATKKNFLIKPTEVDISADIAPIVIDDMGPRPMAGTFAGVENCST